MRIVRLYDMPGEVYQITSEIGDPRNILDVAKEALATSEHLEDELSGEVEMVTVPAPTRFRPANHRRALRFTVDRESRTPPESLRLYVRAAIRATAEERNIRRPLRINW